MWQVGPFHFNLYGLALGAGLLVGLAVAFSEARRKGQDEDRFATAMIATIIAGLVGARLAYILLNLKAYLAEPASMLRLWDGGLSLVGTLIAGGLTLFIASRHLRLRPAVSLDAAAPGMAIGHAIGRVGCDLFGLPTTLPWAVNVGGQWVHPAQAYEVVTDVILFAWLWSRRKDQRPGVQTARFVLGYSAFRFLIEFTREPRTLLFLSPGQWATLVAMGASVAWLRRARRPSAPAADPAPAAVDGPAPVASVDPLQRVPAWAWGLAVPVLLIAYYALNAAQSPLARLAAK
jgi:phosphatidylglycerol:prolipoprotein diacylglycerol transferase